MIEGNAESEKMKFWKDHICSCQSTIEWWVFLQNFWEADGYNVPEKFKTSFF